MAVAVYPGHHIRIVSPQAIPVIVVMPNLGKIAVTLIAGSQISAVQPLREGVPFVVDKLNAFFASGKNVAVGKRGVAEPVEILFCPFGDLF